MIHASFAGRLVMIGFGTIGQGVLPLILRHIDIAPDQITIITAEERGARGRGRSYGVTLRRRSALTRDNYRAGAGRRCSAGRLPAQPVGRRLLASR